MASASSPKPSRVKVREHRERLRAQGLRPIQIWAPDVRSPAFRTSGGSTLTVSARLSGPVAVEKATYTVDDEMAGELKLTGEAPTWTASGSGNLSQLLPGAHYLRVDFARGGEHYTRSTEFFFEPTNQPTAWTRLGSWKSENSCLRLPARQA